VEKLLSRSECADIIGVPASTLANWASEGKGPRYLRVGRHSRYRPADVERWLDAQTRDPSGTRR
jgi:excisionase family DNA binding protein